LLLHEPNTSEYDGCATELMEEYHYHTCDGCAMELKEEE